MTGGQLERVHIKKTPSVCTISGQQRQIQSAHKYYGIINVMIVKLSISLVKMNKKKRTIESSYILVLLLSQQKIHRECQEGVTWMQSELKPPNLSTWLLTASSLIRSTSCTSLQDVRSECPFVQIQPNNPAESGHCCSKAALSATFA